MYYKATEIVLYLSSELKVLLCGNVGMYLPNTGVLKWSGKQAE